MRPSRELPHCSCFSSSDQYVDHLLRFVSSSDLFQILCGGVHILDFFTTEPGLFHAVLPEEWHRFLLSVDSMTLLHLLLRHDLEELQARGWDGDTAPPQSLLDYIRSIRDLCLGRDFEHSPQRLPALPHTVAVGMRPKKKHEVAQFASYVQRLSAHVADSSGHQISHLVDLGSGQNYLGRALASEPYNRHVVAVEGRETNVAAARGLDLRSGLAVKRTVRRNKKMWNQILQLPGPDVRRDAEALAKAVDQVSGSSGFDFRPVTDLESICPTDEDKGRVHYVSGRLASGDLSDVVTQLEAETAGQRDDARLMVVSIHSCGNLSHHGLRSLVLNRRVRAVAIVGCCYNLMTERLGPPTYKHASLRPSLHAVNGRLARESEKYDRQGFPMSKRFAGYEGHGIRLNITARMMACQAPFNWGPEESEQFFTRHFFRAVLQKIFLDRGVVSRLWHDGSQPAAGSGNKAGALETSTAPVTIGSLGKHCYRSLRSYVRGAIEKLTREGGSKQCAALVGDKMAGLTDEEIDRYEAEYRPRRRELCVVWSLMAFSAMATESLIVADRWQYLREQGSIVKQAWVEAVFDYRISPRNLVVVGVKGPEEAEEEEREEEKEEEETEQQQQQQQQDAA